MSNTAVKVEGISKCYEIGQAKSGDFRQSFSSWMNKLGGKSRDQQGESKKFWALKDVSFEIKKGEAVGIIGRNGAGKSTLLKILSRITEPTRGRFEISGRVSSLLEVGTGFHPELSGRENIYLNGTILGMKRQEIKTKFDEIVGFGGVDKFIDTPVKHYSSGMKVRLAFSVAAHLEPEILIIDEVLAVGDAEFQKKCLGKMEDVTGEGRTVIFVSHNMGAVERLCSFGFCLENGVVSNSGSEIRNVINQYLRSSTLEIESSTCWKPKEEVFNNEHHTIEVFSLLDENGKVIGGAVKNDETPWVNMEGEILQEDVALNLGYAVFNEHEEMVYWSFCKDGKEEDWPKLKKGVFSLRSKIPARLLNEGKYRIEFLSCLHYRKWYVGPAKGGPSLYLEIRGGLSDSPYWLSKREGNIAPVTVWE